ncbi:hypothetical protein ACS0TY_000454 [Phlomoides rotata]
MFSSVAVSDPILRLACLPNSSVKLHSTAGKRTVEVSHLECVSPASSIPKSHLTAVSISAANTGIDEEELTPIVLPGGLRPELMPKHVALIMDGNGRWAMNRGIAIQDGHKAGSINLKHIISMCCKLGIRVFTVYAFSTDNWKRSKPEVDFLMNRVEDFIQTEVKELIERDDVRFSSIGNRLMLPESLQSTISAAEESSKANKGMQLVSALSYSGQCDIIQATKRIASKIEEQILRAKDVDGAVFEQHLMTNLLDFPSPDLLIRTSGELRLSNFLLWQLAYTEFYFSDKVFPDLGEDDVIQALTSFQRRQRRFGYRD